MNEEELIEKVLILCNKIDKMWRDDSTQDDVADEAYALRRWLEDNK